MNSASTSQKRSIKTMVSDSDILSKTIPEPTVGCRVEIGGYFGTVRYIGVIENQKGIWYGIEWDDPSRGKHDGSVNGVQYFNAKHPTAGSFVRKEKINFGRTILEAIDSRYGGLESDINKKIKEQQILNLQKSIKAPFIEFVGFDKVSDKQSNYESLSLVSTRLQNVSSIGGPNELRQNCPNIKELDISKNLFKSWDEVFQICEQLEHLYWLNVSENLLTFPENIDHIFPNITVLICGNMELTWDNIKRLSAIFPNIKELRVNHNKVTCLDIPEDHNFKSLEILDLEENNIKTWDEIIKLGVISTLQDLTIGCIGLEIIDFKTDEPKIKYFKNLRKLCISGNLIKEWRSINELNTFPNLEEIRCLNNPILSMQDAVTSEHMIIARIKTLKICNGRRIDADDRRGAEYDYQKKYGLEWLRVKNNPEERRVFLREHNRYLEFLERYGELQEEEILMKKSAMKNALLNLTFKFENTNISKRLSANMTVNKLKILIQKLFKLPDRPDLTFLDVEDNMEISLDDDMKDLHFYSIKDNDVIIVKS